MDPKLILQILLTFLCLQLYSVECISVKCMNCASDIKTAIRNCFKNPNTGIMKGDYKPVKGSEVENLYCIGRNTDEYCLDDTCVCGFLCLNSWAAKECSYCKTERGSRTLASFKKTYNCPLTTSSSSFNNCEKECGDENNEYKCLDC